MGAYACDSACIRDQVKLTIYKCVFEFENVILLLLWLLLLLLFVVCFLFCFEVCGCCCFLGGKVVIC